MLSLRNCGLLLIALTGCTTTASGPSTSSLAQQDVDYYTSAYQLIHFDLLECQYFNQNSLKPIVLPIADKICSDAQEYAPLLKADAAASGVTLPDTLPPALQAQLIAVTYAPQTDLTTAFLQSEVMSHVSSLAVFQVEARAGTDPTAKRRAAETTPLVASNLSELKTALMARGQ
jgi:hypothetical protein